MAFAVLLGAAAHAALAGLGEPVASVAAESAGMKASLRVSAAAGYSVHELQTPAGTVIREFATPDGIVFAVRWRGPFKPDLTQLLGGYFARYDAAPRDPGSTRSHASVTLPDLVVSSSGHGRAFAGLAYLPGLMPANVGIGDLQ